MGDNAKNKNVDFIEVVDLLNIWTKFVMKLQRDTILPYSSKETLNFFIGKKKGMIKSLEQSLAKLEEGILLDFIIIVLVVL